MPLTADQLTLARIYLSDTPTSAVQTVMVDGATAGTFTLTFNGQTTAALAYNAPANVVQNALTALSSVGTGNLTVNNTTPYSMYFTGTLAGAAQTMLTATSSLFPPASTITILTALAGGLTGFSDSDLNSIYDDAGQEFTLTISRAFRVLESDYAKFNDYTAGQSQEKKSQIFSHLKELADEWEAIYRSENQVQVVGLKAVPPITRAYPWQPGNPNVALTYSPYSAQYSRWRRGW